MYYMCDRGI